MMKRIILCEGKSDAILLSYFLGIWGWTHFKDSNKKMPGLPPIDDNEEFSWYSHPQKPSRELAIWGVGGIDNIPVRLSAVLDRNRSEGKDDSRFESIVLFYDSDRRTEHECLELAEGWLASNSIRPTPQLQMGEWVTAQMALDVQPPKSYQMSLVAIALPPTGPGNLETFLTEAIRKRSSDDRIVVTEADSFIARIPDQPYLTKPRLKYKACLGAILSILSPDRVFSELDSRFRQVQWQDLATVAEVYNKLQQL